VTIDYFTKWVKANLYAHVTQKIMKRFIEWNLICQYGAPKKIVELCIKWKIKHSNSYPYRPKVNGVVEVANKNIKDWHEMFPFDLYAITP
jgi:hypothetical protein